MKKWVIVLLATALIVGIGCFSCGTRENWTCPMAVMVDGTVYITGCEKAEQEPEDKDIKGYIRSAVHASQMPEENDQSNFDACVGQPYAIVDGQLLLFYNSQWNLCRIDD